MKKILVIIITLTVILTGCSAEKDPVNNSIQKTQPESTSQSAKDTNVNTDSSINDSVGIIVRFSMPIISGKSVMLLQNICL